MTLDRLINCICYGVIPPRPEGVGEMRWSGMIKMATKLVEGTK